MADPHEPTGTEGRPSRGAVHAAALDREAARRPRSRDVGALRALWPYLLRRKLWLALALLFAGVCLLPALAALHVTVQLLLGTLGHRRPGRRLLRCTRT